MKKKLLALAVCVAMLLSVAPVSFVSFAQGLTFTTYYPDSPGVGNSDDNVVVGDPNGAAGDQFGTGKKWWQNFNGPGQFTDITFEAAEDGYRVVKVWPATNFPKDPAAGRPTDPIGQVMMVDDPVVTPVANFVAETGSWSISKLREFVVPVKAGSNKVRVAGKVMGFGIEKIEISNENVSDADLENGIVTDIEEGFEVVQPYSDFITEVGGVIEVFNDTDPQMAFTGGMVWKSINSENDYINFKINSNEAGVKTLRVYSMTTEQADFSVYTQDGALVETCPAYSGGWDQILQTEISIPVAEGENIFKICGSTPGFAIDRLAFSKDTQPDPNRVELDTLNVDFTKTTIEELAGQGFTLPAGASIDAEGLKIVGGVFGKSIEKLSAGSVYFDMEFKTSGAGFDGFLFGENTMPGLAVYMVNPLQYGINRPDGYNTGVNLNDGNWNNFGVKINFDQNKDVTIYTNETAQPVQMQYGEPNEGNAHMDGVSPTSDFSRFDFTFKADEFVIKTLRIYTAKVVEGVANPADIINKTKGTAFGELGLPATVAVNFTDGTAKDVNVTWDNSGYDADATTQQTINGTLAAPFEAYPVSVNVTLREGAIGGDEQDVLDGYTVVQPDSDLVVYNTMAVGTDFSTRNNFTGSSYWQDINAFNHAVTVKVESDKDGTKDLRLYVASANNGNTRANVMVTNSYGVTSDVSRNFVIETGSWVDVVCMNFTVPVTKGTNYISVTGQAAGYVMDRLAFSNETTAGEAKTMVTEPIADDDFTKMDLETFKTLWSEAGVNYATLNENGLTCAPPPENPQPSFLRAIPPQSSGLVTLELKFVGEAGSGTNGYLQQGGAPGLAYFITDPDFHYGVKGVENSKAGWDYIDGTEKTFKVVIDFNNNKAVSMSMNSVPLLLDPAISYGSTDSLTEIGNAVLAFGAGFTVKSLRITNTQEVKSVETPAAITDKAVGTEFLSLGLPQTVKVTMADNTTRDVAVTWKTTDYNSVLTSTQTITGTLAAPFEAFGTSIEVMLSDAPSQNTLRFPTLDVDFTQTTIEQLAADGWSLPENASIDPARGLRLGQNPSTQPPLAKDFPDTSSGKINFVMDYDFVSGDGFDGFLQQSGNSSLIGLGLYFQTNGGFSYNTDKMPPQSIAGSGLTNGKNVFKTTIDFDNGKKAEMFINGKKLEQTPTYGESNDPNREIGSFGRIQFGFKPGGEFYIKSMKAYEEKELDRVLSPAPIMNMPIGTDFEALELPSTVDVLFADGTSRAVDVVWQKGAYDSQSASEQTISGTLAAPNSHISVSCTVQLQNVEPGTVVRSVYTIDFRNKTLEQLAAEGFALPKNTTIDPEKGLKILNPGDGPSQDRSFIKEFEDKFYGKTSMEMTFSYVSGGGFDGYLEDSSSPTAPGFKLFVVDGGNMAYGENGPEAWLEGLQLQNGQERSVRIDIDDASDNSIGIFIDGAEQNIAPKRYIQTAFNRIHFDFKSQNEFYIKTIKVYKTEYVQSIEQPAAITDRVRGTSFEALGLPKTLRVTHTNGRTENVGVTWNSADYDKSLFDVEQTISGQLTGLYSGNEAAIKVTLQEGETKPYASFTSFTFSGIDSVSTITDTAENAGEVIVSVPEGTDVANLNAVYALDSYAEDFALSTDYTKPVTYVLDNGVNTKTYTVKVQVVQNVPTIPNYIMHADFTTDSLESLIADGWQLPSDTVDPQRGLLISAAQSTLLKAFPAVNSGQVSFEFKYYYVSGGGFDGWLQGSDNNEAIGMFLVDSGSFIHRNGEGTQMNSNGSGLNDGTFRSIRIDFDFDNGGLTKVYIDGNHAGPDIKSAKSDLARVQLGFKAGEFYMKEMGVYRMSKDIKAVANGGNFFFPDEQTEIDVAFTAPISPEFAGRITLTKDGEKIPATVKVTDGGKNVVIVPDEKLAYGAQYTIKVENVQDMYGNDVSQDIVLKTAGEGMVLYDSVSVDDLDTVMTFDKAGMLSVTAQKDGQSVKLPAKWFSVTSSDDKILSVSAAADGYKLTGLKEGVVVLSVESDFYDSISGYKKIVYVTRNAREAANYTLTGATETTEGGNRIITTKQNAVISYSDIDGNFGEKNQKVRLVYANPGAATKATISIGGVSREVTLEKCYSKTDYRVSQAVFQLGKGANTADVSISSPDVKVAALAVVPAIDFAIINKAKADTVEAIFADILPALDLQDDFNKLPNSGKWSVMNAFVAKVSGGYAFDDADALHDYIKELIDKANDGQTGNDPKPERPGNSGSSNKNDKPINVPISPVPTPDWEEDTPQASKHFNDMNDTKWAVAAVDALFEKNIVTGKEDGKFAPGDTVTREEFVAMLVRLAGVFDENAVSQMADVDQNAWYAPYIGSAVNAGLVNGMSETEFGVGQSISREQMAVMIYRAAQKLGVSLSGGEASFTDMDAVSDYAKEAVLALAGAKIVNGLGDGSFAPGASATRAQSAQLLYNLLVLVDEGGAN